MDLGKNIAKARKNAGMTQEQLAEKLQVARQTVSKWEAGVTVPTVPGLVKLAEVLQTDCNSLLAKEEKQPEIKQTETGYVVDWTKLYPILVTYQQEMDCTPYEAQFAGTEGYFRKNIFQRIPAVIWGHLHKKTKKAEILVI